ncbi:hypothetical protein G9A89_011865 [Geosiphon pyriformis]|nr:hypothetical protein G9A89_011865 [Geosiphon pyriformis]
MRPHKPYTKKQLYISYLKDWVLVILFFGGCFLIDKFSPYHRNFSLNDPTIQFPYKPNEKVPIWLEFVICTAIPFVIMTFVGLGIRRSLLDWHHSTLGLALALTLTTLVTNSIKITTGRPRPDFIARCNPKEGSHDKPVYGLSNSDICTWTDSHIERDGYMSFPSGHSSTAFAGLTYLSMYLAGKLDIFDAAGHTYKSFIVVAPYIGAALVAISRTNDYRHHWQDVTVGGLLGMVFATFSYLQYFPPPWGKIATAPYNNRFEKVDQPINIDPNDPNTLLRDPTNSSSKNKLLQRLDSDDIV